MRRCGGRGETGSRGGRVGGRTAAGVRCRGGRPAGGRRVLFRPLGGAVGAVYQSRIDGFRAAGAGAVERLSARDPASVDLTLRDSLQFAWWRLAARIAAWRRPRATVPMREPADRPPSGISVVIPSRNGRALLTAQWPALQVEVSAAQLSFAAAVNRGIGRARYSHVCLLNNDMLIEPGFFSALRSAFGQAPGLFCATAQIRFPAGVRREETGKAVMAQTHRDDFPLRCDEPIAGEDLTWVLYGSGGCSLYDTGMLRALGGMDEADR